ncbi:MAG: hypothetical protein C0498_07915 [Anaerolinea sp.]|nr:hypothetical protein [Anaerolinea sp.]
MQAVGVVPDDPDGDRQILELAAAQIGHAAVLRGPARELEPADIDLALRYLPDVRVIVTVGAARAVVVTASEHASWSGAALVVVDDAAGNGRGVPADLPDGAIELQAPPSDPDGTFAGFVGALAARLNAGVLPAEAWAATSRELAVDRV